jgi:hypothetical protein
MIGAAAAGAALGSALGRAYTQIAAAPDYSLRIAPLRLELAPGKVIDLQQLERGSCSGAPPIYRQTQAAKTTPVVADRPKAIKEPSVGPYQIG